MSTRDVRAYLHDIIGACDGIRAVLGTADSDTYLSDPTARLATERELITIGEAVARMSEVAPEASVDWAASARAVVGLRNVLVHGYFKVDDARVFEIASEQVPLLRADAHRTLQSLEDVR